VGRLSFDTHADAAADAAAVADARGRERGENFPVALRLLPRKPRRHLHAVYAVARLIDDTGDAPDRSPAERIGALDDLAADLDRIWAAGDPAHPVLRALVPTVVDCAVTPAPFHALLEANRVDQVKRRYDTFDDLRGYCALSADPVGHLVLAVAGQQTPRATALSDRVCTALQVLEHCQDVVEDHRDRDRVYVPLEDLVATGASERDLSAPVASPELRAAVALEVDRAAQLLAAGVPLVHELHGWARLAVAGYVAGGRATVDAFRQAEYDVVTRSPRPRRRDVVRHTTRLLAGRR
jgi:squalene synthase HpnC